MLSALYLPILISGVPISAVLATEATLPAAEPVGRTVRELVIEKEWLTEAQLDDILDVAKLTAPRRRGRKIVAPSQ